MKILILNYSLHKAFIKIFVKTVSPSKKARVLSKISIKQQGQSRIEKIDSTAMVDVIRWIDRNVGWCSELD